MAKEQRFEKVVEWKYTSSPYTIRNLMFNSVITIILCVIALWLDSLFPIIVVIGFNLIYLFVEMPDRKVYWRRV